MKSYFLTALAIFSVLSAQVAKSESTKEIQVNISNVYIPSGFDNKSPFVVLNGIFPNSCYTWKRGDVKHVDGFTHEVQAFADVRGGMCLMVLVPYSEEVEIGTLEAGKHKLRFKNSDGTYLEKEIDVQ